MRALPILLASFSFFCAQAQDPAKLEGIVRNAITGEPLDRVHVALMISVADEGFTSVYGAMSDSAGRFSFSAIKPGTYFVCPERVGFAFTPQDGGATMPALNFKEGQSVENYRIAMSPRAVISGLVLDEIGTPMRKVSVEAEPAPLGGGPLEFLIGSSGYGSTNDRGQYRISLPAGKYRIKAEPIAYPFNEPEEIRTDGTTPAAHPVTWYPRAANTASATVVVARPGIETGGIDIRLGYPVRLRIDGIVTGIPSGTSTFVNVNAMIHSGNVINDISVSPDGRFSVGSLEQGTYYVHAGTYGKNLQSAVMKLELSETSVSNLVLALKTPAMIVGTLEMERGAGDALNRVVALEPLTGASDFGQSLLGDTYSGTTNKDGAFEITGVTPERYRVAVHPLGENDYVKTVRLDEVVAASGILDLRDGADGSKLKITVSNRGARISGTVESKSGLVTHGLGRVFVIPEGAETMQEIWHAATIESDGTYRLQGIAPGTYRLFAVDHSGAQSLKERLAVAETIDLTEGDQIVKNIRTDDRKN